MGSGEPLAKEISSSELREHVDRPGEAAFVLFHGSWCHDCKAFMPTWNRWATDMKGSVFMVEILRGGSEWRDWGIDEIPTVAAFKDGSELGRAHGSISERDLDRLWKLTR